MEITVKDKVNLILRLGAFSAVVIVLIFILTSFSHDDVVKSEILSVEKVGENQYSVCTTFTLTEDQIARYGFRKVQNGEFAGILLKKK